MRKTLNILASSLRLTLQELKNNKLRTALSLTGIAFGIFCIIGVLAVVGSLERNIQDGVASLGSNTIYVDKWNYGGGNLPFWKMRSRPSMKYEEAQLIRERSGLADAISFFISSSGNISFQNDMLEGVSVYGINPEQIDVQPLTFIEGRYFSGSEFSNGSSVAIIGFNNAEKLYGSPERALGKTVEIKGRKLSIIGVTAKSGRDGIGFNFDDCLMLPYHFFRQIYDVKNINPVIIVKGKDKVPSVALIDELTGIMRQIRRLSPTTEDNFALNSVEAISKAVSGFFVILNIVGSIIGGISLIVGMFGIANIMFVTVKERTPVIGLKKAIGAKSSTVLFEFLAEAALLCLMGGTVGIIFVWILTLILSGPLDFPVYISLPLLFMTFVLCLVVGILAGIIPARRAAKMDPVVAIRS